MGLFSGSRRKKVLAQIKKESKVPNDFEEMMTSMRSGQYDGYGDRLDVLFDELWETCRADSRVGPVLGREDVSREEFMKSLRSIGWDYQAARAMSEPRSLEFVLAQLRPGGDGPAEAMFHLTLHYKQGRPLP
jgi:hypothetical protein